jgi:hypothetical protein
MSAFKTYKAFEGIYDVKKINNLLGTKSHSLTRSLWLSSVPTRSESAGAPCLYHSGKER